MNLILNQTENAGPRQIEAAFKQAISSHPDGRVAAVRVDGLFCEIPAAVPLNGQQPIRANAGVELVAPECRALILEQFRQVNQSGANEIQVRLASGAPARYALFDLRPLYGVIMLLVAESESPDAAQASPGLLQGLAPIRPRSGRVRRTDLGRFLEADEAVLRMLGYPAEAFAQLDTAQAVHPDDYDVLIGNWFDLLSAESGSTRRARVRYKCGDGTWLWVEVTITQRLDCPRDPHMLTEIVDISDEMAAIDEVWRSREFLRRLTEGLPVGILQIGIDGQVIYSNDRLHTILGSTATGSLTTQLGCILSEDRSAVERLIREALENALDGEVECRYRRPPTGDIRFARLACRVLRERDGAVAGAVVSVSDETDNTLLRLELEHRATVDMLTQCLNRASVMDEVDRVLSADAPGSALVYIDLNRFKAVNDRLGHAGGDDLLKLVAARLRQVVRDGDVVGRLGGDEFLVVCAGVADRTLAAEIATRIDRALRFDARVGGEVVAVSASIGVAWTDTPGEADQLVAAADKAMYQCKRSASRHPVVSATA